MTRRRYKGQPEVQERIEPGMVVEAAQGDLGETDISKARVTEIERDQQGHVEQVKVEKGILFKKELEIPEDRIKEVTPESETATEGKVVIDANEAELQALTPTGQEQLASEVQQSDNILDKVEQAIPTHEGMREMEQGVDVIKEEQAGKGLRGLLHQLGPGLLGGLSGNDSSAVTAYAINGATSGFSQLWLLLISTPMYQAVLYTCAKIGRITQKGFSEVMREHYSKQASLPASLALIIANVALIAADLVAIGSGLQIVTTLDYKWFIIPVAIILWYLTVFRNFEAIKKIFIVLSLAFVTYIITAVLVRPQWSSVLFNTFVPHFDFTFTNISNAVALLGATLTPYTMYWQVQGEKEEQRPGSIKQKLRFASLDIAAGAISGNLIAYFIIVATASTVYTHHKTIGSAIDAAQALTPVLGPIGKYLFALGLIGSGLIAIPILLASTSYAVAGTFGWPSGLSKQPWQNEGFYLILSTALIGSMIMALMGIHPIQLIFWANIISGILAPVLVAYLLIIANNRKIMGKYTVSWLTNLWLGLTMLVLVAGVILLCYGLLTGHSS